MYHGKLQFLPCGAVTAEGWLREQFLRSKDGMGGKLSQLEPKMILDPYLKKKTTAAWGRAAAGWGAEIAGNYWYGLIALAFALPDGDLQNQAEAWVNGVLAVQEEDGYLGAYGPEDDRSEDYNAWGNACGMRALLLYAEATGREDVLEAVHRGLLWFCRTKLWHFTVYTGQTLVRLMANVYLKTGDRELLDFCHRYEEFLDEPENDLYRTSTNAFLDGKLYYNQNHAAGYAVNCSRPAALYLADGDLRRKEAAVTAVDTLRKYCLLPNGGISGNAEWLSPKSATAETEYCTDTFLCASYALLAAATGDPRYGDYLEEIVFNAAQGARKKDEKAITYFTAPNQLCATDHSSHVHDPHGMYAPVHSTSCCSVNSVVILPEFVKNMAMCGENGDLYLLSYAPCRIKYRGAELLVKTHYPFRREVTLEIQGNRDFAIHLRKPQWCDQLTLDVPYKEENGYLRIEPAEAVHIILDMKPRVQILDDTDSSDKHPLWVSYGPLCLCLPLKENWINKGSGYAQTPLPEDWNWYEVQPIPEENDPKGSLHRLDGFGWNFATTREALEASLEVEELALEGYVWEHPPLAISAAGWQAPYLYNHYTPRTNEPYGKTAPVTFPRAVKLVPFGCTALRVTCFPRADI